MRDAELPTQGSLKEKTYRATEVVSVGHCGLFQVRENHKERLVTQLRAKRRLAKARELTPGLRRVGCRGNDELVEGRSPAHEGNHHKVTLSHSA